MKLYVDELPKSCSVCSCGVEDEMCCCWCMAFEDGFNRYICSEDFETKRLSSCPLQSLADYTKQVRKEVCEEIKDLAGDYFELPYCDNCGETLFASRDVVLTGNDLTEILDQIQGESK